MKTLEELRDFINSTKEWDLSVNDIIEENGWNDETGEDYGICSDDTRRLYFRVENSNLIADITELE